MFEQNDIDELNDKIIQWDKNDKQEIIGEMRRLGIIHRSNSPNKVPLYKAFQSGVHKQSGLVSRIKYSMPRSAVFLHKGVSRSHPVSNPRKAKEWFSPVLDKNLPKLEEIVADGAGTLIVNALKIK